MTTTDAHAVAASFYAELEKGWNAADGPGFAEPFSDLTWFVDVRGVRHVGGRSEIGSDHQGIFDTIYKDSEIRYEVEEARQLGPDVVLANGRATLRAPSGPLAGEHNAVSTVVLTREGDGSWRATSFHNTLVTFVG